MSSQQRASKRTQRPPAGGICSALTTSGQPCRKRVVPGLTVCSSHGGGTAASQRASKRARVSQRAVQLWGLSPEAGSVDITGELERLARNKLTDITALRLELGENPSEYYGLLVDSREVSESDFSGRTVKQVKRNGTHPLVQELHKAEAELLAIFKLLQEVSGGSNDVDVARIRLQTAREAARILKAFPGISVDDVAAEVSKSA